MGRSVSTPNNTRAVAYTVADEDELEDFHEYLDHVRNRICAMFPASEPCNEWVGREDQAIAENALVYFGVSEYCGLIAIWIAGKDDGDRLSELRDRWVRQNAQRFIMAFQTVEKIGTFSNGEAVFQAMKKNEA